MSWFQEISPCLIDFLPNFSVKDLERRILELESESEQLSLALESQKRETFEAGVTAAKKTEDILKETQKKVGSFHYSEIFAKFPMSLEADEIEQLKQRLKLYADYDEIKRELEIMKVVSARYFLQANILIFMTSVCRVCWSGRGRRRGQW